MFTRFHNSLLADAVFRALEQPDAEPHIP